MRLHDAPSEVPLSLRAYGLAWRILGLRPPPDQERKWQRYLAGERPSESAVAELVSALAETLRDERTLGLVVPECGRQQLADHIKWLLGIVDVLPADALRELLVEDVGAALAGWYLLQGVAVPSAVPTWLAERDDFLERVANACGLSRRRMHQLVAEPGPTRMSKRILDGLLSGADTPSEDLMTRLARMLARASGFSCTGVLGLLRTHYAARRLFEELRVGMDSEAAAALIGRVLDRARLVAAHMIQASRTGRLGGRERVKEAYVELLCNGCLAECDRFDFNLARELPGFYCRDLGTVIAEHEHPGWRIRKELSRLEASQGASVATANARAREAMMDAYLQTNAEGAREHAYNALRSGDYKDAIVLLTELVGEMPEDVILHSLLAHALECTGLRERAVLLLREAPKPVREDASSRLMLAGMGLRAEDYELAEEEICAVLDAFPTGPQRAAAHELYAVLYADTGHPQKAARHAAAAARGGRPFVRWLLEHQSKSGSSEK